MRRVRTITVALATALILITAFVFAGTETVYALSDAGGTDTASDANTVAGSFEQSTDRIGGGYALSGQIEGVGYMGQIYDATNGLPTSDANFILGSSDGYVWIGGYSGIIRYDGAAFERMDTSGGLTSGRGLFEDSEGRIWVATNDNGVVCIDGDIQTHFTYKDGLRSSSIRNFAQDRDGNVYIGTTAGAAYVDTHMMLHDINDERLNNERILRLEADRAGVIYGFTKSGYIFTLNKDKVTSIYTSEELGLPRITNILPDPLRAGRVYLGTTASEVYYGTYGDDVLNLRKISIAPIENVQWMCYACDRLWICSKGGFGYLDSGSFRYVNDLPFTSAIEMITSDYQGNLWLASSTLGIMKVVTNNFRDITLNTGYSGEVVNVTCEHDGRLYIGTDSGLSILDENNELIEDKLTEFIGGARVRCIAEDTEGNLWVSTFTHDLGVVRQGKDGSIKSISKEDGLSGNEIRCVVPASDGSILVGSNTGLSIIKDEKVVRNIYEMEGIDNPVFLTVAEGDDGEIYVGTDGDGIYVISGDEITKIGRNDGLTSDVIMRIKKDEDRGVYWIVTSNSIQYMRDGVISNVSSFPYNNNYDIYYDNSDNAWVLSSFGVYCVSKEALLKDEIAEYRLYTAANGLTATPTSNSYSALSKDGNLYIAGRTGVSLVNINDFYEGSSYINVGVSSVTCDGNQIRPDGNGTYTIPAKTGRIQISPAVLDYTMTNPLVHVFLEGADDDGITATRNKLGVLEYTGLKYGTYILHIQILSNGTNEIIQDEEFKLVKSPRLFELLIVKIFLLVLLALAVGLFVYRIMSGTVIRKQYEEIRQARDEAERANSAKSRFLANMSHEIRTPINTIMGMDEMILREDATDVPQSYFLSVVNYALDIRNASESLLGLINDLLDISKIESGKMHLIEQEYDIAELLRSIVPMIRVRSNEKDLAFEVNVDELIPSRLYGDSGKIKQIILNLLTNAVKYTSLGGFKLTATLESRKDDVADIRFSVKDTGIGIKQEDMDRLFTAYERLDEEKNGGIQGTGLGLDISRRFAALMGGELKCNSVYGEGSEFIFTISQKIMDRTPTGKFIEHVEEDSKGPYVPKFVAPDADVLVVDDNPMNLNVIKGLLKATKMFVTTASSGEECLEKIKYGTFNVVLLDHMMPGMDGVETLERIREDHPDLPVYALTANTAAGEEFYISRGFNGYLSKPINSAALEEAILKYLPPEIVMKSEVPAETGEPETLPDDMQWVKDVEGLSVDEGIKNSGGISSFIHSVGLFHDTIDDCSRVIESALAEDDIKLYTIKVHSLKSSARIVGAIGLSEMAQKLEDAGNKEDRAYIEENSDKLLDEYRAFKDKLGKISDKSGTADEDAGMIDADELKDAYEALKEVVPQMDYDSVEMILEQLSAYKLPDEDARKTEELGKKLRVFDWEGMEQLLEIKQDE